MRCDPRRAATASGRRRPWVSEITPTFMGHGRSRDLSVGDELEQRAIGIAEVDAHPIAARTCALDRSELGGYAMCVQMCLSLRDRSGPLETQIAVSRRNGAPRHRRGIESGPVTVELQVAKSIGPTIAPRYSLCAHHIPIERVRPRPVRDMDDAVIELELGHCYLPRLFAVGILPHLARPDRAATSQPALQGFSSALIAAAYRGVWGPIALLRLYRPEQRACAVSSTLAKHGPPERRITGALNPGSAAVGKDWGYGLRFWESMRHGYR